MKKRFGSYNLTFMTVLLLMLLVGGKAQAQPIGEDPGPVYTQMILQWAKETHFAQNAAEVIVAKFKLDMENNPKMKAAMTPELIADLEQFFYELFLSPETIKDLAALYAQYFTLDDMQDLIKFYQSPVGQKLIKNDPAIKIGTQHIGEALLKRHEKEYMGVIAKHLVPEKKAEQPKTSQSNFHLLLPATCSRDLAARSIGDAILYGKDDSLGHFPLYTTVQATTP